MPAKSDFLLLFCCVTSEWGRLRLASSRPRVNTGAFGLTLPFSLQQGANVS